MDSHSKHMRPEIYLGGLTYEQIHLRMEHSCFAFFMCVCERVGGCIGGEEGGLWKNCSAFHLCKGVVILYKEVGNNKSRNS